MNIIDFQFISKFQKNEKKINNKKTKNKKQKTGKAPSPYLLVPIQLTEP
jgi:hypothetical protein